VTAEQFLPSWSAPVKTALGLITKIMKCWICGAEADSREHLIKASDMRAFFGRISPRTPVFLHSDKRRNIPVHSAKTNKIKTENKVICRRCNDTETAIYDNAWSELLSYFHANWDLIKKSRRAKLHKAFPGNVKKRSLFFHLYFVKLFGCRIVDENMPIDISEFSKCVKEGIPHKTVYLTFNCRTLNSSKAFYAGPSEVHGNEYDGKCEMATWYYTLGELDIQISWFLKEPIRNVPKAWHPKNSGKIISFRQR
jgi:hypothetical protein